LLKLPGQSNLIQRDNPSLLDNHLFNYAPISKGRLADGGVFPFRDAMGDQKLPPFLGEDLGEPVSGRSAGVHFQRYNQSALATPGNTLMTVHHPIRTRRNPQLGQPTWDIAQLCPAQGSWNVDEYLNLNTNHLVEFSDGVLEFPPMPTEFHQFLMLFLYNALSTFTASKGLGMVLAAPMKVRINARKYREPDVLFMLASNAKRRRNKFWEGADLVMEVVSPDDPARDFEDKRKDYALAGVPEYWIVDPERREIIVLTLKGKQYIERGVYGMGRRATSGLLKGFGVDVSKLFKAADAARASGGSDD
jgi:Uma2 family endonuclease